MNYQAFIFDFDYTLGDSTKGIVLSANDALERLGLQRAPEDMIRRTIGLSLKNTYAYLTGCGSEEQAARLTEFLSENRKG